MSGKSHGHSPVNPNVSELKMGPFIGGINRYSDPSAIADSELVDCVNFDIDLDGSLKSRPPWSTLIGTGLTRFSTVNEEYTRVLGTFVFSGYRVILLQSNYTKTSDLGVVTREIGLYINFVDGPNAGLTSPVFTSPDVNDYANPFSNIVRYKDTLYVFRAKGGSLLSAKFTVDPVAGNTPGFTLTSYPPASKAFLYKERMWLVGDKSTNTSRMYFSDVADPNTYQAASFFDIRPGDGDTLNEAIVYQDNVYLFKNGSIWVFAYDTQPTQAVLQLLHASLGVDNEYSTALYENVIYFLKWNQVYQIANYDFTRISTKLPFEEDKSLPVPTNGEAWGSNINSWIFPSFLSLVGDRLIIRYFNRLYVYHLRMRAWSRWNSQDPVINYMGQIIRLEDAGVSSTSKKVYSSYVAGSCLAIVPYYGQTTDISISVIQMNDTYDSSTVESTWWTWSGTKLNVRVNDILASIKTKIYDLGISHRYKRLLHWGVDVVTGRPVTGILSPFSLAYRVTWDQLVAYTWAQLQTWGYPLFVQPNTTQNALVDSGVYRRFIRFPKSLRFRLLQFEVKMITVGNTIDGPARIYSITGFTALKQLVPKGAN